jgi:hypothetical protein
MAFTAGEITNIANAALDFYFSKGDVFRQTLQKRPFWDKLSGKRKSFPGGKGSISLAVSGKFGDGSGNDVVKGYTHNDTVNFYTPANLLRAAYPWREHHLGLMLTHTELKIDGISVVDTNGAETTNHSGRDMTVLVGLLEDKLFDLGESYARSMNLLSYGDGVADPKAMAGVKLLVADNPAVGIVGGINRATAGNEWWRNLAKTAASGGAVTSAPTNGGVLLQELQKQRRQLVRYGGAPTDAFCGSDFIGAMETELRANGLYTQTGFKGTQDGAMGGVAFAGTDFVYDPTMDDLGLNKRCYWLDLNNIFIEAMTGEWMHNHSPARPPNQFLLYRSITTTCQMVAKQLNSSLVIDIA